MGAQKGDVSCPKLTAESNRKKDSSSFLARPEPMKIHELFVYYSPTNFLFPSIKNSPFLAVGEYARGLPQLHTPNFSPLLISINSSLLEKYLFLVYLSICFYSRLCRFQKSCDSVSRNFFICGSRLIKPLVL